MIPADPDLRSRSRLTSAVRSLRLLGFVCSIFGLVIAVPFGYFNKYHTYRPHFIALGLVVWFIPGVLYLLCGMLLREKNRRAAAGAIAVASVQAVFALGLLVATIVLPPISAIPILLCALWSAALWDLILRLVRLLPQLERGPERRHGFEISLTPPAKPPQGPPG